MVAKEKEEKERGSLPLVVNFKAIAIGAESQDIEQMSVMRRHSISKNADGVSKHPKPIALRFKKTQKTRQTRGKMEVPRFLNG